MKPRASAQFFSILHFSSTSYLYVRIWTIKIARAIFARLPFRGDTNAKKRHAYVRPRFTIERVRSVFLTDFLQLVYTSYIRRSRRASSFTRVHPPDIDLTLFSISLFFCHAEHRKASPNSLRFYGFWQVTSDRFHFNLKCRRISAHTRSQIFSPHLYKVGLSGIVKIPHVGILFPDNWDWIINTL